MFENLYLNLLYIAEDIRDELFQLVQSRSCSELNTRLHQLSDATLYLSVVKEVDRQQVSLLMLASSCGYDDIVRVLLVHDNTSDHVEMRGRITLSDETLIDGATALYCACYNGHFTVAKTLIELGQADVNQTIGVYQSYPLLLHATINNRRDIIDFLLDNKYVDINQTTSSDRLQATPLILAISRGNTPLVEYLISKGADVNDACNGKDLMSSKPIGCAVQVGNIDIVRLLYHAGADTNIRNGNGYDLINVAVKKKHPEVIDFLLNESINTIEDLELSACSLIKYNSSIENMEYTFTILKKAIERREQSNTPKICAEPVEVYDYQRECQTADELDSIKDDPHRIYIETILILERIALSRNDISIVNSVHDYGEILAENGLFEKSLNVLIHMFNYYENINMIPSLHQFVWLFCRILRANQKIPVQWFLKVARLVLNPSQTQKKSLTIMNAFFLVIIATKILEQDDTTRADKISIHSWISDVCRYRSTNDEGWTILHFCVARPKSAIDFRKYDILPQLSSSIESAIRLLLVCGGRWLDLDAVDSLYGCTPLHHICYQSKSRPILELFLKLGCHTDCIDRYGMSPLNVIEDPEMKSLFPSERIPSKLKCLCARLIVKQRLNMDCLGTSTSALKKFVVLHGYHAEGQPPQ